MHRKMVLGSMKGLHKYMPSERESAQGPFLLMHIL